MTQMMASFQALHPGAAAQPQSSATAPASTLATLANEQNGQPQGAGGFAEASLRSPVLSRQDSHSSIESLDSEDDFDIIQPEEIPSAV
ncbi:hypothetical protein [Candidatus Hepatobacter penaei]|uniref:hypothetical protein n=1 Tax=Candidatus Hepatobacter penaei TaxID=1274402 RepID=UPI0010937A61|nr:hypothetical protein [Candidatus Hepatobacter penaei]TGW15286.1 hypothetical protein EIL50_01985 [bacterium NHP-B]